MERGQLESRGRAMHEERDTRLTRTYVAVVVIEAIVIALLWALGRMYS
jgi:hypothetical protein